MPSKEELLSSIQPDMKLTKNFFMRIYGYDISFPGFAEIALSDLEKAGCGKARSYYHQFVGEYEKKHDEEMKNIASWYKKQDFWKMEVVKENAGRRKSKYQFNGLPQDW